jgi:hypothetical protein
MVQAVEHLPSKHQSLSSNPRITKKKKKKFLNFDLVHEPSLEEMETTAKKKKKKDSLQKRLEHNSSGCLSWLTCQAMGSIPSNAKTKNKKPNRRNQTSRGENLGSCLLEFASFLKQQQIFELELGRCEKSVLSGTNGSHL